MIEVISENFQNFPLGELPYDHFHTALGEYHYIDYYKNYDWYDPIPLHQWRSLDGSWLINSKNSKHILEQNRSDPSSGAFKNVFCVLAHKEKLYAPYQINFNFRLLEPNRLSGVAFNYTSSRKYFAVFFDGYSIKIVKRNQEEITEIDKKEFRLDDLKTYKISINLGDTCDVYVDDVLKLSAQILFEPGKQFACVSKALCQYSDISILMDEKNYYNHLSLKENYNKQIMLKRQKYAPMKCIKKIDLKNFGSGRQLRIAVVDSKPIFVMAQHQKRVMRDAYARLSCLSVFDYDGNILWQDGEADGTLNSALISCDLPFQIADINNDKKLEVIYSIDFEIIVRDLISGKELKRMPTPYVVDDKLVDMPFYRLNVDAIRVADFKGLGYKGNFIIKDRYHNVWAFDENMKLMWRYNHKNTGHFPYIADFNDDKKDEMFVGYDMVDSNGKIIFSLPMDQDHTDEIIFIRLKASKDKQFVLASGNEGLNIVNKDGSIYRHIDVGHAQRISVAPYLGDKTNLQICATSFWGADGIIYMFDCDGKELNQIEQPCNGNLVSPVNYDGKNILCLLNSSSDGGLVDGNLDKVVLFLDDGHPTLCSEVFDIDSDGIDEILCWDNKQMWIYKSAVTYKADEYEKYPNDSFSNYRGEYLLPLKS